MKLNMSILTFAAVWSSISFAKGPVVPQADKIYRSELIEEVSINDVLATIEPGSIVIVSELHNSLDHHRNQLTMLQAIETARPDATISVGMEFLYLGQQDATDSFVNLEISEEEFLQAIVWNNYPFSYYSDSVLFPSRSGGRTLALNAPSFLTSKISREGLASLTGEDRTLLPPDFTIGRDIYFEKFKEALGGGHGIPEASLFNYFTAQSLWDDTMAFVASEHLKNNPQDILVIIVGDFHASYGGGLPDRLKARGVDKLTVVSQVNTFEMTNEEKIAEVGVHPLYGVRADFVWVSEENLNAGNGNHGQLKSEMQKIEMLKLFQ